MIINLNVQLALINKIGNYFIKNADANLDFLKLRIVMGILRHNVKVKKIIDIIIIKFKLNYILNLKFNKIYNIFVACHFTCKECVS